PQVEQVRQAARAGLVVSGLFIREQQAGILGAALGGGQSPLGIEQDGAGVRRQHFGDQRLELFHHGVGDVAAFFLGERFLQRAALVDGGGGDDAAIVGNFLQSGKFSGGELHVDSSKNECGIGRIHSARKAVLGRIFIVIRGRREKGDEWTSLP